MPIVTVRLGGPTSSSELPDSLQIFPAIDYQEPLSSAKISQVLSLIGHSSLVPAKADRVSVQTATIVSILCLLVTVVVGLIAHSIGSNPAAPPIQEQSITSEMWNQMIEKINRLESSINELKAKS